MFQENGSKKKRVLVIISDVPRSRILKNTMLSIDKDLVVDVINVDSENLDVSLKMLEDHMYNFYGKYSHIFIDSYFVSIENDKLNNLYKKEIGYDEKSIAEKTELSILHSYNSSRSERDLFKFKDIIEKTKLLQKGVYKIDAYKRFFAKLMSFESKIADNAKIILNSLVREANEISCKELDKYANSYHMITFLGNKTSDNLNRDLISKNVLDYDI